MLIALIIIIIAASAGSCSCDGPTPGCDFPVTCVSSCSAFDGFGSCGACPSGTFESWMCSTGFDAGFDSPPFLPDASDCDLMECFRPYDCVYGCDDETASYVGCCECTGGTFDRVRYCEGEDAGPPLLDAGDGGGTDGGTSTLLPLDAACFDDRQCESGQCYGAIDAATGMLAAPTCRAACIPEGSSESYCLTNRNCCGSGACSSEGLCDAATPPPPAP